MGLSQDLGVFGELVQQAAAAGSADALFALGSAFFHGEDGFARDPRAAFRYVMHAGLLLHERGTFPSHPSLCDPGWCVQNRRTV